jgi:rubrerythrin
MSLLQEAPHLAKEWITEKNNRPIEKVTTGSHYKAWWKCKSCDHQWEAVVANRVRGGGCGPCSQLIRKNRPYIVDKYKNLTKEWVAEKNDRPIEEITAGSGYKAWWECKSCNHQWEAIVKNRVKGIGCPSCAGRHGTPLTHHLKDEWVIESNDRALEDITSGSGYRAWWACKECGHQWQAEVKSRARGSGCGMCAGYHGKSLLQEAPHLAKEWITEKNNRPIEKVTTGSNYKAWWQCKTCENQWEAKVQNRTKGSGCPACFNLRRGFHSS